MPALGEPGEIREFVFDSRQDGKTDPESPYFVNIPPLFPLSTDKRGRMPTRTQAQYNCILQPGKRYEDCHPLGLSPLLKLVINK